MAEPTPGPWSIEYDPALSPHIWLHAKDNSGILMVQPCDRDDGRGECLDEEDWANARAAAALPEMLEALQKLSAVRPCNWEDDEDAEALAAWRSLDSALAKAKGIS